MLSAAKGTIEGLLSGEAWLAWTARTRGLGAPIGPDLLEALREESVKTPLVAGLMAELAAWPGPPLASHRSAEQRFHLLAMAAELGVRRGDPGADAIAQAVMSSVSEEGPFALPLRMDESHGGSGVETGGWALCDAPVIVRALVRMGYREDPRVAKAAAYLRALVRENGYPCAVSSTLGNWRGPGKKGDPCPYATLVMLELLLDLDGADDSDEARAAAECLLNAWEHSRESHPYMFFMGTDFRKLKAPLIWYDLLHVLEALSRCSWIHGDPRLDSMLDVLEAKADSDGAFTPESIYQRWKAYDFGQKKAMSPYITAVALGILGRCGRV